MSWQESLAKWCRSKEAAKAQLATAVAAETAAQVEDGVTDKEEKLDEQYAAIKIDYENEVISEV